MKDYSSVYTHAEDHGPLVRASHMLMPKPGYNKKRKKEKIYNNTSVQGSRVLISTPRLGLQQAFSTTFFFFFYKSNHLLSMASQAILLVL